MRTTLATCMAFLLLMTGVALAAQAPAGTYTGKTKQKKKVSIQVGDASKVLRLDINWRAKCKKPKKFWTGGTTFSNPGTTDSIAGGGGSYTANAGSYTGLITPKLTGQFTTATKANGTFKAHVKVMKNGKKVDSCNVTTKWTAKAATA